MDIEDLALARGGVVHRDEIVAAGQFRALGRLLRLNRAWYAHVDAPPALVSAALVGGRITCVTAAHHLGLPLLARDERLHVMVSRGSNAPALPERVLHRDRPLAPSARHALVAPLPDLLSHVAVCLPHEEALAVWEGAVRSGRATAPQLRRIPWRRTRARALASVVGDRSDSILETLVASRLRGLGIAHVQQARLLGHAVDFLIGDRLVLQVDGFAHHSDARQRHSDVEHDARLLLEGYVVLRVTYRHVVHEWEALVARLQLALAQRLDLGGDRSLRRRHGPDSSS